MPDNAQNTQPSGGLQKLLDGLQGRISRDSEFHPRGGLDTIYWHGRHICRIDVEQEGATVANGTGFLVASDLVLTNYHVIENFELRIIKCRFDYKSTGTGTFTIGPPIDVQNVAASKPYSKSEKLRKYTSISTDHPSDKELDYALLRLSKAVGEEIYNTRDGAGLRGWIALSGKTPDVHPQSLVHILQHPNGKPLQSADGRRNSHQPANTRLRYTTTTLPGSSGSPCFQFTYDGTPEPVVVALHNYGDPGWGDGELPEFNHGIPIERIVRDLRQLGIVLPEPPSLPKPSPVPWPRFIAGAVALLAGAVLLYSLFVPAPVVLAMSQECIDTLRRADITRQGGNYELAIEYYQEAAKVCPINSAHSISGEAATLYKAGNYTEAVKKYDKAYELVEANNDQRGMANMLLGKAYALEGLGEYDDARDAYRSAQKYISPVSQLYRELLFSEGRALTKQWLAEGSLAGNPRRKEAITAFEKFVMQNAKPKQWAYYYLACLEAAEVAGSKEGSSSLRNLYSAATELRNDNAHGAAVERDFFRKLISTPKELKRGPVDPPVCPTLLNILSEGTHTSWLESLLDGF